MSAVPIAFVDPTWLLTKFGESTGPIRPVNLREIMIVQTETYRNVRGGPLSPSTLTTA